MFEEVPRRRRGLGAMLHRAGLSPLIQRRYVVGPVVLGGGALLTVLGGSVAVAATVLSATTVIVDHPSAPTHPLAVAASTHGHPAATDTSRTANGRQAQPEPTTSQFSAPGPGRLIGGSGSGPTTPVGPLPSASGGTLGSGDSLPARPTTTATTSVSQPPLGGPSALFGVSTPAATSTPASTPTAASPGSTATSAISGSTPAATTSSRGATATGSSTPTPTSTTGPGPSGNAFIYVDGWDTATGRVQFSYASRVVGAGPGGADLFVVDSPTQYQAGVAPGILITSGDTLCPPAGSRCTTSQAAAAARQGFFAAAAIDADGELASLIEQDNDAASAGSAGAAQSATVARTSSAS